MGIFRNIIATIAILCAFASISFAANGYGTSTISLSHSSIAISAGSSASVNYSVELATGNTWGTNLVVVNQNQLASQGISVSLSDPSGDPPFSGSLSVHAAASASAGTYSVVLAATGDDPSSSNATLTVSVAKSPSQQNSNSSGTSQPIYQANTPILANPLVVWGVVLLIVILAIIGLLAWRALPTKLIVVGVALILVGTWLWIYGDYGAMSDYAWVGAAAILIGTLVWVYADFVSGAFRRGLKSK